MKNLIIILLLFIGFKSCVPKNQAARQTTSEIKPEKNDDGEWELTVFDPDYENFLRTVARPMSMYSEQMLKSRNSTLVNEWNSYYFAGRYRNVIESSIDYDVHENYGLEFEYRLYQVFSYVSWKYNLRMRGLSGVDAF